MWNLVHMMEIHRREEAKKREKRKEKEERQWDPAKRVHLQVVIASLLKGMLCAVLFSVCSLWKFPNDLPRLLQVGPLRTVKVH